MKDNFDGLVSLVRRQGEYMRSAHEVESKDGAIKVKPGDANFVTVYDEKIQNNLIAGLKELFPDALFFAEEKDNSSVDTTRGYCFIIDPIDGTTNFIHDMGASAVSVGMMLDGEPYFGLIYDPYRDELICAERGSGAYLNGRRVKVSERSLDKALFSFGTSPYDKATLGAKGFRLAQKIFMRTADVRRSGSAAIDIMSVACGRTDLFFESKLSPWDYAAGLTVIKEAGGFISDFGGNNLPLNTPSSFVCSNEVIYKDILKLLSEEE